MAHYAGIGSRDTPLNVQARMTTTAVALDLLGYSLRSGGARGADSAFERGIASGRKEIFLPWPRFNGSPSSLYLGNGTLPKDAAFALAARFHPAWNRCTDAAHVFHARNCFQILGPRLDDPVAFVICWTPGGKEVGGAGQALRLARAYDIPITNLGTPS